MTSKWPSCLTVDYLLDSFNEMLCIIDESMESEYPSLKNHMRASSKDRTHVISCLPSYFLRLT